MFYINNNLGWQCVTWGGATGPREESEMVGQR
jgi:hypothetical protein